MKTHFHMKGFALSFAKGNSEMTYCLYVSIFFLSSLYKRTNQPTNGRTLVTFVFSPSLRSFSAGPFENLFTSYNGKYTVASAKNCCIDIDMHMFILFQRIACPLRSYRSLKLMVTACKPTKSSLAC